MTPFQLAQQAADIAYDMTIERTGDGSLAADDYKSVMDAYHGKRVIMVQHASGAVEIDPVLMTMEQVLAGRAARGMCDSEEMEKVMREALDYAHAMTQTIDDGRDDWRHIKGDLDV